MKRIFSLLLVMLMAFSFVACNLVSNSDTNTATNTNTSTDTETSTNTETDTATSTKKPYVPDYTKDMAKYNIITNESKTTLKYLNETLTYPTVTKYLNGKQAALSMTFDDANNADAARIINEVFAQYGDMRGTIMANVGTMLANDGPEPWKEYFEAGYLDLGCHGYDHAEPTTLPQEGYAHEIGEAFEYLRANFPDQKVLTYATPNAHINGPYEEYLKDWCIANRLEAGGEIAEIGKDFNMYRIYSTMIRESTNLRSVYNAVETGVEQERWIVHLFHDIIEDNAHSSYNPTKRSTFESYCRYLQNNFGDEVWFGSFEDVALYANQYGQVTIDYTGISRDSLTFETHCSLPEEYRVPIGIKVQLPRFVDSAIALINGVPQELELDKSIKNMVYTVVKDVPSDGATIEILFGGNTTFRNSCVHTYAYDSVIESSALYPIGYTIYKCSKCDCIYKSMYTLYTSEDENKNVSTDNNEDNQEQDQNQGALQEQTESESMEQETVE